MAVTTNLGNCDLARLFLMNHMDDPKAVEETFGVYTEVRPAYSESGYPSITLYTSRGDSPFGRSVSAYWNLTLDEAVALGTRLIEQVGRANVQVERNIRERTVRCATESLGADTGP